MAGADVYELCSMGETLAYTELANVYKKNKSMEKGIAFPLCISVNEICGHYSPMKEESMTLSAGDVVKIDLGIHIDGFIAMGAHTVVVPGGDSGAQEEEKKEDDA